VNIEMAKKIIILNGYNMKKILSLTILILVIVFMAGAQDLTLEGILANHYKAVGYEKLQKVNTILMTGTMIQQDAMPVKIFRMRPDKFRMEFDIQDITAYQGYDGQVAWWTAPWTGNPKPQVMPADRARDLKSRADFDGLLYNWKEKGHVVQLAGLDTIGQALAYKLKVTKNDGSTEYYSIDTSNFLVQKRIYFRTIRGQEVPMEYYYTDYRSVQGVMFAFTQDLMVGGQPYNSLQFDEIELDKPIDVQVFHMPEK
jgi:hypothetical protein